MNDRCDEFVYYRPPLTPAIALRWFGELAMVAIAAVVLLLASRRRTRVAEEAFGHDPKGDGGAADPAVVAADTGNRQ